jgi:diguanylate cyclase (GGDEF)-like protein
MFKIKPVILLIFNVFLWLLSWYFYKAPQGDEYLVIFIIPVIFVLLPFVSRYVFSIVFFCFNLLFFIYYCYRNILNPVDVMAFVFLLGITLGAGYTLKALLNDFLAYHDRDLQSRKRKYRNIVTELESIDRRGRIVENELNRISKLYEITKKLVPVLKFDDLIKALFDFVEKNFNVDAIYFINLNKEKITSWDSRIINVEKQADGTESKKIDVDKVLEFAGGREYMPFYSERSDNQAIFERLGISSDTFMAFPLFVGERLSAIFAIEGASRASYSRFRILTPQIALEIRKVELYEQIQELSIIDGLTRVYLRRYLTERLEEEVDRAGRLGLTFSIAMIDVDFFKACNDKYGHLVGDAVLKEIANRFKSSVREVDMISRYGGEEFCVVLPETAKDLAVIVSERLRRSVESKGIRAFDEDINITISAGVATYPEDGENVEILIEKADTALYKAKRKGRNQVCVA